ncbi:hypothetical protein Taro_033247 [Colocasia esculenta]|uniref:Uncharacterized protein n=1 Tax=Colocasia esculenta TaxID=4460 RepID=A0A843WBX9_COLES|nr:hypothetical protein [Colocasia esculenta]
MERAMPSRGSANLDDDVDFQRLMLGPTAPSQSMREASAIASSQPRRNGSHTQSVAPSHAAKGKEVATSQLVKRKDKGQACGPAKDIVIREPPAPTQKKKSWFSWGSKKGKKMVAPVEDPLDIANLETLDLNAEETPSEDSPRLPNSRSHDSMTIGSPGGSVGGGDGDGGGDNGNDEDGGGEGAEQRYGDHCTQDGDHGAPVKYNRRRKFVKGGRAEGSAVDSDSYNTMIYDFDRMSTHESVGSYGGHSYQAKSSEIGYLSGYTTTTYPAPYFYPPPSVPVQIYTLENVQMASLRVVCPGCEMWDHYVREFRTRYNTMMSWDEFRTFISQTKSYHLIGELPSESNESVQPQWGTYDPYQQRYWGVLDLYFVFGFEFDVCTSLIVFCI